MDEAPASVHVQYCQEHYDELTTALLNRQLHKHVSKDQEELIDKLQAGKMDALLESSNAITAAALQMFGPHAVTGSEGCPICTFKNVINHVADHMAMKYRRSN